MSLFDLARFNKSPKNWDELSGVLRRLGRLLTDTGLDHGALTGLADDDHTQYIKHSLATAASDFLVASGVGVFIKKTLAETKTVLSISAYGETLIDDADAPTARSTLGLGDSATKNVGTAAGTVAAGDHGHAGLYVMAESGNLSHSWFMG